MYIVFNPSIFYFCQLTIHKCVNILVSLIYGCECNGHVMYLSSFFFLYMYVYIYIVYVCYNVFNFLWIMGHVLVYFSSMNILISSLILFLF